MRVRRDKKLKEDMANGNMKIICGVDNPELYSFDERKREGDETLPRKYTVYSYNQESYNITLKFPKISIVFLGNKG